MALRANALTTVAAVDAELGVTSAGPQVTLLERYINAISQAVEQFLGRTLQQRTLTEQLAGHGGRHILLAVTPTAAVDEVRIDGQVVTATEYRLSEPNIGELFRDSGWPWTAPRIRTIARDQLAGEERESIEVDYAGGFFLPPSAKTVQGITTGQPLLTFSASATTIARDAGDWTAEDFTSGDTIHVRGTRLNDGTYTAVTVAALLLTLAAGDTLVDEDHTDPSTDADDAKIVNIETFPLLPIDIEQAVIEEVVSKFRNKGADRKVTAEKLLSASVTYDRGGKSGNTSGLSSETEAVLMRYQRVFG